MKKTLIVGGANGIGWALTQQLLHEANDEIIVADRDKKRIDNCTALEMDLADPASVDTVISFFSERRIKIDRLIVTAAIHTCYPFEHLTDQMIDEVFNVNLISQIKFIKKLLPHIKEGGSIVGISSIAGGIGVPMESLYSASKAGLEIFFECLAVELQHRKIHVSIIRPGNVNTGFNEKGNDYQGTGQGFIDEGYKRVVSGIDSSLGMSPKSVAQSITRVLKAKKPKFLHVVGLNAKKAYWAKRFFGNNLALKLMAKHFGF